MVVVVTGVVLVTFEELVLAIVEVDGIVVVDVNTCSVIGRVIEEVELLMSFDGVDPNFLVEGIVVVSFVELFCFISRLNRSRNFLSR